MWSILGPPNLGKLPYPFLQGFPGVAGCILSFVAEAVLTKKEFCDQFFGVRLSVGDFRV